MWWHPLEFHRLPWQPRRPSERPSQSVICQSLSPRVLVKIYSSRLDTKCSCHILCSANKVLHMDRQLSEAALFLVSHSNLTPTEIFCIEASGHKTRKCLLVKCAFYMSYHVSFPPWFFFLRWKKMQLAFPVAMFITVINLLTEAYLFTLRLLVPRETPFTIQ